MFNNLVECAKTKKESKTWAYLAGTSIVWTLALAGSIVGGIFLYDAKLDEQLAVLTMLVTPPPPPAAPAPMGKTSPKVTNNAPKVAPQNVAMRETPKEISSDLTPHPAAKSLVKVSGTQDLENIGGPGDGPGTAIKTGWGILDGDPTSTLPEPKEPKDTKELKVAEPVEKATPQIIRKSEGVIRGNTIYQAKPEYPAIARTASVSGDVQVEIVIGEDGNVVSTKILSGQPLLQQAALSAARQWKFKPTLLNNTPVKVQGVLTFRFTL